MRVCDCAQAIGVTLVAVGAIVLQLLDFGLQGVGLRLQVGLVVAQQGRGLLSLLEPTQAVARCEEQEEKVRANEAATSKRN